MVQTMTSKEPTSQNEAREHMEGPVARTIEHYTAQMPSDWFLWAAGASVVGSLGLMAGGNRHASLFVGQWAPTFLLLGIYNKIVKVAGSDRLSQSEGANQNQSRTENREPRFRSGTDFGRPE